jgi:uncharacterized protein (TIGR00252 family)
MSSFNTGRRAEAAAAEYLRRKGFSILAQNWRTRRCEIDIVARKGQVIFFVEVKYRKTDNQGDELEYITQKKLEQMYFAAEQWVDEENWRGDYRMAAIAVTGEEFHVTDFVDNIF